MGGEGPYLVVKPTRAIEELEERRVSLATPKVHIGDLKIAPNCIYVLICFLLLG
jgi:hypothetical protein